ncbi:Mitotic spindle checkpoint component mad2 [Mucor velutinosus]|uniref:Mitotic spindle checkpoint component mad2 n=1 Tax=Mucor velutinosus TaxID=708070 RepID=A0AAN7HWI9_9FUNG|nr:Mitotic spindle checkpoint component mad2 [Mucor velutinosus]
MKSAPGVPLTIAELQLSSPLPSPNRHPSNTTAQQQHQQHTTRLAHTEASSSNATILPQLHFDSPYSLNPDLYPLANITTPHAIKKFTFKVDEKHGVFEEIQATAARKRSASIWDDERSYKRTELENIEEIDQTNNTALQIPAPANSAYSPGPSYAPTDAMVDIIPDSPNSALPSPVSDLDHQDVWQHHDEQEDDDPMNTAPTTDNTTPTTIATTNLTNTTTNLTLLDTSSLFEMFDTLPDNIQTYLMFQLLKRSPRNALRMANATIMQALKKDIVTSLPESIAEIVLSYLDIRSLCRASGVNHSWKHLIDNASEVWKLKMKQLDFVPTSTETLQSDYRQIVRRHTIMRRNWRQNLHHKMLLEGHEEDLVTCLQFDDEKIITGSDDHSINVYDIKTGKLKSALNGHDGGVWALQYVGNTLVTGSIDRTIRVWDIEKGTCRFILRGHSSTVRCLKIVMPTKIVNPDGSVTMEPSEPIIVSGSRDMTIRVWRLPDLEKEPEVPLSTCLENDVISQRFLKYKLVEHEHSVRDLALYGNILVSGSYDNNVIVWNLDTGRKMHILKGHTMKVYCVAIDPKRRHCISGSLDASVRIWGIDDGECKFVLQGHAILVGLLGLVDDCLVSAAADATLRIWDPSNGDRLHILAGTNGHQGPITSFQHDKYKIISGSEGGVKMWDTQTGELMYDLIEDVAGVWRVCFDERRCIAAVKNEHKTQLIVLDFGIHGLEGDEAI